MTSADLRVANRPREVARRLSTRGLLAVLAAALAALAFSAPSFAVETTSSPAPNATTTETSTTTQSTETGYSQTPELKEKEGVGYKHKPTKPKHEVRPAEEKLGPKSGTEPIKETAEPVAEPVTSPESELPFTGYDLRWVIGIGLLLIVGGTLSLWAVKRRERHGRR